MKKSISPSISLDPSLPSTALVNAAANTADFFQFMNDVVNRNIQGRIFSYLYDRTESHPEGILVGHIAEKTQILQSTVSWAVTCLVKKGFIQKKKDGSRVYCWVPPAIKLYLQNFVENENRKNDAAKAAAIAENDAKVAARKKTAKQSN